MWTSERIIAELAALVESYDQSIRAIEPAERAGEKSTVFGGELGALVAVCSDIERVIEQATAKVDSTGDWLRSLKGAG